MLGPLTYLDAALIAVALLSGLLAMYRGFTREMLSILSWAIAGLAVVYVVLQQRKIAEDLAQQIGAPLPIAQIGIGAVVFLIVLVIVHLVTSRISDSILDSRVGMIDRMLGFVFGIVRGFVLVVIPYMFYESFVPDPAQQHIAVREAKSLSMLKSTGDAIRGVIVRYVPSFAAPSEQQQGRLSPAVPAWHEVASNSLVSARDLHISVTRHVAG
jgi:membrane protein required for colicin V production